MSLFRKFKTVYPENNTFLKYSLGKKEEINYSQVQMFENETFSEYLLPFRCTKTSSTNNISWDISGLTSLSEFLRTEMQQNQYFEIVSGIQKVISFCEKTHLSYDNLVCNPKYMYYDVIRKRVLMVYFPLKDSHYICDNIPESLMKIHKNAKNVIITDGNYLKRYETYLNQFIPTGRRTGAASFSPDSLRHFFNENNTDAEMKNDEKNPDTHIPSAPVYSINSQITQTSAAVEEDSRYNEAPSSSPTVIIKPAGGGIQTAEQSSEVYLTDTMGKRYDILKFPFNIGRNSANDLVVKNDTVSGYHAVISEEDGKYYIRDMSANGTFINNFDPYDLPPSIKKSEITDGDKIYFYSERFIFSVIKHNTGNSSDDASHTVMVARRCPDAAQSCANEKAVAYIKKVSDNSIIRVMGYPFSHDMLEGIRIYRESASEIFIQNISCPSLELENTPVDAGNSTEIFSGCTLTVNGEKYTFIIEN